MDGHNILKRTIPSTNDKLLSKRVITNGKQEDKDCRNESVDRFSLRHAAID